MVQQILYKLSNKLSPLLSVIIYLIRLYALIIKTLNINNNIICTRLYLIIFNITNNLLNNIVILTPRYK